MKDTSDLIDEDLMKVPSETGISGIHAVARVTPLIKDDTEKEINESRQAPGIGLEKRLQITLEECHQVAIDSEDKDSEYVSSVRGEKAESIASGTDSIPLEHYDEWGLGNDFTCQYHSILNLLEGRGESVYEINYNNNSNEKDGLIGRLTSIACALLTVLSGLAFTLTFTIMPIENKTAHINVTADGSFQPNLTLFPSSVPTIYYETSYVSLAPNISGKHNASSSPTLLPSLQLSPSFFPTVPNHSDDIMAYLRSHPEPFHNNSYTWKLLGKEIYVDPYQRYFGNNIAISSSGSVLFIGLEAQDKVCVFQYLHSNDTWSKMMQIKGPPASQFGKSLAVSDNGMIIAISGPAFNSNTGIVRIFSRETNSNDWFQMGYDIMGKYRHIRFGQSISISGNGQTFITGTMDEDFAQSFEWNGNEWQKKGRELHGDVGSCFGKSVSITYDGNIIVIGAPKGLYVEVYKWRNSTWKLHGFRLNNFVPDSRYGYSVSISSNGDTFAVGAPGYNDDSEGKVYVYTWDQSSYYVQKGDDIRGTTKQNVGTSLSLSDDGMVLIYCTYQNNHSRAIGQILSWNGTSWNKSGNEIPHRQNEKFALTSDSGMFVIGISMDSLNNSSESKLTFYSIVPNFLI